MVSPTLWVFRGTWFDFAWPWWNSLKARFGVCVECFEHNKCERKWVYAMGLKRLKKKKQGVYHDSTITLPGWQKIFWNRSDKTFSTRSLCIAPTWHRQPYYYGFARLKEAIAGKRYENHEEIKGTASERLKEPTEVNLKVGIEKLISGYRICLDRNGNSILW